MVDASWTQKGLPNRCPVCGTAARVQPDLLYGELFCSRCGVRLWFFVFRGEPHFFLPEEFDSLDLVELVLDLEEEFG